MSLVVADWVLLAGSLLLAVFVYIFLRHLLSLFLLLFALWVAWRFRDAASALLTVYIADPTLRQIIVFSAIVLAVVLTGAFVGYVVEHALRGAGVLPLLQTGRFLLSLAFSCLLISGGLGFAASLPLAPPLAERNWWQQSRLVSEMIHAGAYFWQGSWLPGRKQPLLVVPAPAAGPRQGQ